MDALADTALETLDIAAARSVLKHEIFTVKYSPIFSLYYFISISRWCGNVNRFEIVRCLLTFAVHRAVFTQNV